jgi:hypothetical protein
MKLAVSPPGFMKNMETKKKKPHTARNRGINDRKSSEEKIYLEMINEIQ